MKKLIHLFALVVLACGNNAGSPPAEHSSLFEKDENVFAQYWYSGKAELASYDLIQSRYGEDRMGSAVLIFVTEPFSGEKQVKLDDPSTEGGLTVMKLNFSKKFITGIYPYSMMMSVFTPVDDYHHPNTLKVSMSSQEWCGNTFTQLNFQAGAYRLTRLSYFESEGDTFDHDLRGIPEDEIWNRVRLDPDLLPQGEFQAIPGTFFTRFSHSDTAVESATGTLQYGEVTSNYTMQYASGRSIKVVFDSSDPHVIREWNETAGDKLISSGKLKSVLHTDYWNQNSTSYEYLRDSLMLN